MGRSNGGSQRRNIIALLSLFNKDDTYFESGAPKASETVEIAVEQSQGLRGEEGTVD